MHDAALFEELGIPATVLVTTPFVDLARATARNLGLPDLQPVVIPHPIFTWDAPRIVAQARAAWDDVLACLTVT